MRLFFYAVRPSLAAEQYFQNIVALQNVPECVELPVGGKFQTLSGPQVLSGDVVLLFAVDNGDIKHLQHLSEYLEDFSVILVLGNSSQILLDTCYAIRSRFVCRGVEDITVLHQLLIKMFAASKAQSYQKWGNC